MTFLSRRACGAPDLRFETFASLKLLAKEFLNSPHLKASYTPLKSQKLDLIFIHSISKISSHQPRSDAL